MSPLLTVRSVSFLILSMHGDNYRPRTHTCVNTRPPLCDHTTWADTEMCPSDSLSRKDSLPPVRSVGGWQPCELHQGLSQVPRQIAVPLGQPQPVTSKMLLVLPISSQHRSPPRAISAPEHPLGSKSWVCMETEGCASTLPPPLPFPMVLPTVLCTVLTVSAPVPCGISGLLLNPNFFQLALIRDTFLCQCT